MFVRYLFPVLGAALLSGGAAATALESSIRPVARPAAATPTPQVTRVSVSTRSLRPKLRPEALSDNSGEAQLTRVSNPAFDNWVRSFRGRALSRGVSARVFDAAFQNINYNADVVSKDRNQAEFKRQIWDYLDSAASPERVDMGQQALSRHRSALSRIEQAYGVEAEVVTAVWGLESKYGTRMGDIPVIEALSTLSFDGRRGAFFEKQLIAALKILQNGDTTPRNFLGSWAGAMGHTQFIPTSYEAYAVDFTGDGRRDIWSNDPSDALASTAAYLKRFGWRKGMPWGVEVRVPNGARFGNTSRMPSQWAAQGVVGVDGRAVRDYGSARIIQPAGPAGASFMVFANFDVIKRYNNADAYAIGVGHLSDRIKGGPGIQASWPRGYTPVSFEERKEIQRRLKQMGYPLEKIDGIIGPNTAKSIMNFQQSAGMKTDGFASREVLKRLRSR
ncbi:Membrane-bound lytic murein transglycosylase B precursor [Roseovarius sp. THAF8]|uniref:lytic murein transglycosylase n=1 Tax=Roseovarius sp. THAF8 TaxID=2587846 RepID=UPI001268A6DA|nr:lytic murein transglycosylase [Roseovarius sp. THAF8]QFT97498.1 Membrane-bound lytic murein transglycosylase B precursor [Roseovarius sp. THAF8]